MDLHFWHTIMADCSAARGIRARQSSRMSSGSKEIENWGMLGGSTFSATTADRGDQQPCTMLRSPDREDDFFFTTPGGLRDPAPGLHSIPPFQCTIPCPSLQRGEHHLPFIHSSCRCCHGAFKLDYLLHAHSNDMGKITRKCVPHSE